MSYAKGTSVPIERSLSELRSVVAKYGADGFGFAEEENPPRAMVMFRLGTRQVRLIVPFPPRDDKRFTHEKGTWRRRSDGAAFSLFVDEKKRCWRAVLLVVKAKFEAVSSGISTIEREFLADLVLPNGRVVHEELAPRLAAWSKTGEVVALIPESASP